MDDLTTDDLRVCASLRADHLDHDAWAPIPVEVIAVSLLQSRQSVTDAVARLVAHGSLERKTASIMRGDDVVDSGLDIYRLT
ncbi:hypothetical protein OH783_01425 [Kocuria rhizophila]|uniref:hypothetical protein n=1 Tax=Kocuria rhizophila TaxID=72000 RepID=UPI00386B56C8|nr:hypothetical protein OH783_01425 [Kocuria rhizophila]WSZ54097.1 hypothetical protein OG926_01430 [Kocuria rhizophila]